VRSPLIRFSPPLFFEVKGFRRKINIRFLPSIPRGGKETPSSAPYLPLFLKDEMPEEEN